MKWSDNIKAKINNKILSVKIVDNKYNNHAKEVVILEGAFQGKYTIVENSDFIRETKTNRYYVQQTDFINGVWKWVLYAKGETYKEAVNRIGGSMYNHCGDKIFRILDRQENKYY